MADTQTDCHALERELAATRRELEEARAVLAAIRAGEIDAVVVDTTAGPAIYALKSADEPYRTIVETLKEGAVTTTSDGVILYCNDAFARLVGGESKSLIGASLAGVFGTNIVATLTLQGGALGLEWALTRSDGSSRDCLISSVPHRSNGHTVWCLLITDVTGQTLRLRHNAIIESTDDAVMSFDRAGRITTWNRAAEALFGYAAAEAIGADADLLQAPPYLPQDETPRSVVNAALSGVKFQKDTQRIAKNGTVIDVAVTASPLITPDGCITGVSAMLRDIRVRKAAEQRIARDLEAMVRLHRAGTLFVREGEIEPVLHEILDAAIALAGADYGTIQSPKGSTGGHLIIAQRGLPRWWLDCWSTDDTGLRGCHEALARGERVIVEDIEQSPLFAGTRALAIQREIGVRAMQSTPLMSRSGELLGILSTHWKQPHRPDDHSLCLLDLLARQAGDIIERKRSEATSARLAAIVAFSSEAIISKTLDGTITSWNAAAERIFGYTAEEMIGTSIRRIVPADRQTEEDDILARIGRGERLENYETVRVCKGGRLVDVSVTISPIVNETGQVVGASNISHDITERKQAEERERLLMREVNHRAKNMLSLVQAIARQTAAASPQDFVRRFEQRVQALGASQDVLVECGWKNVPLGSLIRAQLGHFADSVGHRIHISGPDCQITAAAAQAIGMAVHELATNAAKYGALSGETGRVELCWRLTNDGAEPEFAIEWVEKDGPPVAKPAHSGFGSTVTGALVEMSLEGKVEIAYAPSGVVWHFRCPASKVLERKSHSSPPQTGQRGRQASPVCSVLVVEDDAVIATEVATLLQNAGFQVLGPATSVERALKLIANSTCDAAVLDVQLGAETAEPIARRLSMLGLPFVTVSAYAIGQRPASFGSAPHLGKPLRPELLVEEIKRCFDSAR